MSNISFRRDNERGMISGMLVAVIALSVVVLGVGSFAIWAYVGLNDAQSNLDDKIAVAVAQAKGDQSDADQAKFAEQEKQPNTKFQAPDDYCGLTFMYPKTWSAYESEQITNGGDYKAYLQPKTVPYISESTPLALRVLIQQKDFDSVLQQYQSLVQKSSLKQSNGTSNGQPYTRLTGDFSKQIRGDAVIYKCRDKTITVQTTAGDTFHTDFESIIRTIDFNS
jgi:hypothetical protein